MPTTPNLGYARKALLLGVLASSAYAFSYLPIRQVGSSGIHPFQIAFIRTVLCFLILAAFARATRNGGFRARRPGVIVARGILSAMGLLLWFYGLVHLPLAEATTLGLTTVCFAAFGAAIFLNEPFTRLKALAMVLAIGGATAIIRPGFATFQIESLAVIAAAACWGTAACLVRSAARVDDSMTIALWTSLVTGLFSLGPALMVWRAPTGHDMLLLVLLGALTAFGMIAWTQALKYGETTLVTMTDFTQLIWAIVIGFFLGEIPNSWSIGGMLLVSCAIAAISFDTAARPSASG